MKMVTFRENHSVIFDKNCVADAYMYNDTIYILCYKDKLYSYRSYFPVNVVCKGGKDSKKGIELLKKSKDAPPILMEIVPYMSNYFITRNLHTNNANIFDINVDPYYNNFRYIGDKLVVTYGTVGPISVYNDETGDSITYDGNYRILRNDARQRDVLYLIHTENDKKIVRLFDIINGETEDLFEYNFSLNGGQDLNYSYIFELDGIVYFIDYCKDIMYCYDKKTKICSKMKCPFGRPNIFVFNKKGNKMYSISSEYIREYDIIRDTLFKSSDILEYSDIDIVANDNVE